MLKKPVRKPFSKGNYKKNDKVGKQAVLKYLHSIDIPAAENPDWGADLIVPGRDASYEVEVRRIWTDKWPHPTVHIPERKTKLMHKDNLVYAVVNTNLNRILFCRSEVIRQYKIVEVPNKSIEKGEFFYDVPIHHWTMREVPSAFTHDFVPAHRNTDPITSVEADIKTTKKGVKTGQQQLLLGIIKQAPQGLTYGELADLAGFVQKTQASRRMPELERMGLVERHYNDDGKVVNRRYNGYAQQIWFLRKENNG